ncbi:hypothetical protein AGMMS49543_00530 [Betaproteobacteria bacterium]|nr:hypothetical protein AGMMS49543_00530 [Betaproteobacteria bacterium]GHU16094.1 hypothetical protein AGMMS50243_01400 [Betaproteobacteria bacterium]
MRSERFCLGIIRAEADALAIAPCVPELSLTIDEYSRFKYGDSRLARVYGEALAHHLLPRLLATIDRDCGEIHVTSSAYRNAPPASAALLAPFLHTARILLADQHITHFKTLRAQPTNGDYATLGTTARKTVMQQTAFGLPEGVDLRDRHIVALDDIRVTGAHEAALDKLFAAHHARRVTHLYILDVAHSEDPTLEARLNDAAIADIDTLIAMTRCEQFTPNARFGKRIMTETPEAIHKFIRNVSAEVVECLITNAADDGLDRMQRYQSGFSLLAAAYGKMRGDAHICG